MTASPWRRFGAAVVFSCLVLGAAGPAPAAEDSAPKKPAKAGHAAKSADAGDAASRDAAAPAAQPEAAVPRHGARSKAPDGTVVVYDKVAGAWRAPAIPEAYWVLERFYRFDNGIWLTSKAAAGPWELAPSSAVPEVVREGYLPPKVATTAKLPSGIEAVYEPRLKVFKVAGHKGVFLFDGTFYRNENSLWLGAPGVDGPWAAASPKPLPIPLRKAVGEPADGQEAKLPTGETVVWDGTSKVFTLKDKPGTVLHDGKFYEKREEKWFASASPSAGFAEVANKDIPAAVRFKFRKPPQDGGRPAKDGQKKPAGKKAGQKTAAERKAGKAAGADEPAGAKKKKTSSTAGEDAE